MADSGSFPLLQQTAESTAAQVEGNSPELAKRLRTLARRLSNTGTSGERRATVDALVEAVKEAGRELGRRR